jgi:hypothetical protein
MGQWKYWFPGDGGRNEREERARTTEFHDQLSACRVAEMIAVLEYNSSSEPPSEDYEVIDIMLISPEGIRSFWTVDIEREITASAFQNTKLPEE